MVASSYGSSDESSTSSSSSSSLSHLVNDMLQSHREMQQDFKAIETSTGMPQLGDDGVYRIVTEQEFQYVIVHALVKH